MTTAGAASLVGERPTMVATRSSDREHGGAPSLHAAAIAGLLATYGMDLAGGRIVAPALRMTPPGSLGRWVGHMFRGRFTHEDIRTAPPIAREATVGMVAHYAIGLTLGVGYGLLLRAPRPRPSSLPRALAYGVATTVFPWFWMYPARGQGVMGLRERDPRVPAFALCTHAAYGLGLGVALR